MNKDTTKKVKPVPEGYHTVTPYVVVKGVVGFLDFMKEAFGAVEEIRVPNQDGTIGHAEVRIGDSVVMAFDAKDNWPATPGFLRLYVEDADALYEQALKAGAVSVTEMSTLMGERGGRVCDPLGNIWWIQTHVKDVVPEDWMKLDNDPAAMQAMQQTQDSFDQEMRSRIAKKGA